MVEDENQYIEMLKEQAKQYIKANVEEITFYDEDDNTMTIKIKFSNEDAKKIIGTLLKKFVTSLLNP